MTLARETIAKNATGMIFDESREVVNTQKKDG